MERSGFGGLPLDLIREGAEYLTPEELEGYAAISETHRRLVTSDVFCRDYYNRRVPVDLQLNESPMDVPFCRVVQALPRILPQIGTLQTIVMRWERCVVPSKDEFRADPALRSECHGYSLQLPQPAVRLGPGEQYGYLLLPHDSNRPVIRLLFGPLARKSRGPPGRWQYGLGQRWGEWLIPTSLLRSLLVALVVTEGHLFLGTEAYPIGLVVFNLFTREELESVEARMRARTPVVAPTVG